MTCSGCSKGYGGKGKGGSHREYIRPLKVLPNSGCPGGCANVSCAPRTPIAITQEKLKLQELQRTHPQLFLQPKVARVYDGSVHSIKSLTSHNFVGRRPFQSCYDWKNQPCCC